MTPVQQQLNSDLPNVEAFVIVTEEVGSLKAGQDKIIKMIEDNEEENKREFDKGSQMFKDLYGKVEEMNTRLESGFDKMLDLISSHIQESKDTKIERLTEELKSKKKRSEYIKDGIIIALIGGGFVGLIAWTLQHLTLK